MELEFETNLTDEELKHALGIKEAEEIHKRFEEGKETLEDLLKNYISYHMNFEFRNKKIDADMIELKYYKKLINYIYQMQGKVKELEENNARYKRIASLRLDDIEEFRKNECEHRCIKNAEVQELKEYYQENYTPNDKIKAKIEEVDKEEKEALKGTKGQDRYSIKQEYMHKRSALQSLLEKE